MTDDPAWGVSRKRNFGAPVRDSPHSPRTQRKFSLEYEENEKPPDFLREALFFYILFLAQQSPLL